jgi:hypothetical protein
MIIHFFVVQFYKVNLKGEKMQGEVAKIIEILQKRYPDVMVLDRMDGWERAKLAGKVEMIEEIKAIVEDELHENKRS